MNKVKIELIFDKKDPPPSIMIGYMVTDVAELFAEYFAEIEESFEAAFQFVDYLDELRKVIGSSPWASSFLNLDAKVNDQYVGALGSVRAELFQPTGFDIDFCIHHVDSCFVNTFIFLNHTGYFDKHKTADRKVYSFDVVGKLPDTFQGVSYNV